MAEAWPGNVRELEERVRQALRLAGCGRIIAVDIDDVKLKVAKELGATEVINPKQSDVPAYVRERTEGRGADVAVEVVGATVPIQTALVNGAPRASTLKIWSSVLKPPAKAISGTRSPLSVSFLANS